MHEQQERRRSSVGEGRIHKRADSFQTYVSELESSFINTQWTFSGLTQQTGSIPSQVPIFVMNAGTFEVRGSTTGSDPLMYSVTSVPAFNIEWRDI
ncbi:hypothetical protein HYDPIDRAFT_120147 [Hydnomerulius pinastri MD-312]|uniref:Unplaced genomic scaffold scaffold_207, whole genome shotgun sequence n=1 Tax=Hydnomerulius pinastri MD-312 TaxID=994086 RepID=A0A0C9W5N6_9AGAM|nr:hypothetical protein HYDPIDRAFT_120147 [Hydnomerulius pinastri MD-312]